MSDRARWGVTEVAPTGKQTVFGHINRGDKPHIWGEFEVDCYPRSEGGELLCATRMELRMGLREASRILGLSVVDLSRLEMGKLAGDFDAMITALREAAEPRSTPPRTLPGEESERSGSDG